MPVYPGELPAHEHKGRALACYMGILGRWPQRFFGPSRRASPLFILIFLFLSQALSGQNSGDQTELVFFIVRRDRKLSRNC